jgi:hypothetical protein
LPIQTKSPLTNFPFSLNKGSIAGNCRKNKTANLNFTIKNSFTLFVIFLTFTHHCSNIENNRMMISLEKMLRDRVDNFFNRTIFLSGMDKQEN